MLASQLLCEGDVRSRGHSPFFSRKLTICSLGLQLMDEAAHIVTYPYLKSIKVKDTSHICRPPELGLFVCFMLEQLISNVVLVPGVQQSESAIHVQVFTLFNF